MAKYLIMKTRSHQKTNTGTAKSTVTVLARVTEARNGAEAFSILMGDQRGALSKYLHVHLMPETESTSTQYAMRDVPASWVK